MRKMPPPVEAKERFEKAAEIYKAHSDERFRARVPAMADTFALLDEYVRRWHVGQACPAYLVDFETQVAKVKEAYNQDVSAADVGQSPDEESDTGANEGDVGWWPGFGPSDDARKTFALATKRFDELLNWGIEQKLPHRKPTIESVKKYRDAFGKGDAELAHLGGFKGDIESLAKEAAEKGFVIVGGDLPRVDVESVSSANAAAAAAKAAQENANKALAHAGEGFVGGIIKGIGTLWTAIPTGYKIGIGVGVAGVLGVGAAAYGKQKAKQ